MKVAFIGAGNMAMALIGGMINHGASKDDLLAIDLHQGALDACAARFGVATATTADSALQAYDVIVLAVKPQLLRTVAASLAPLLQRQLVLSIAAGIRLQDLSRWLGNYTRLVRAMPNTPAMIGLGATGLVAHPDVGQADKDMATQVLNAVGITIWVDDEAQIDAVTAVSGSGPAYVFYFIEALQQAGVQMGLNAEQARLLAISTFNGAAQLAVGSSEPVQLLRERVTSKGGTTAAALAAFEHATVRERIIDGAIAAKVRAAQLGNELGCDVGTD